MRVIRTINLWPPFGSNGTTYGDLLAAVRARILGGDGRGLGVAAARSYLDKSPSNPAYPFVVVNWLNETPRLNNLGETYRAESEVQVTVLAQDAADAKSVRDAAYALFKPHAPKLLFDDGFEMTKIPGMKFQWQQAGQGPNALPTWAYGFNVRFLIHRSF